MMRILILSAACIMAAANVSADPTNAIMRLLNSRASGSVRGYAEAAAEVAEMARKGHPVYGYVLALVSQERDAPKEARLDDETRKKYFDGCREKVRKLANEKNNPMAWYLLSQDSGDTNLLCRAADLGNVQAQNAWGSLLFSQAIRSNASSNDVEYALGVACSYFRKAAGQGDANGLYNLGTCEWRGLGAPRNEQNAFNCFRAAAEKGHPEAINNIGAFFREGIVVDKDPELSVRWFAKSASYGNAFGQFNYGLALQNGQGIDKDEEAAVRLFEKSAEGGCVEAINTLGVALWKGRGVKADPRKAFRNFLTAARAGYPPAMENLSTCYEKGVGVEANERKSMEWKVRSRAARGDRAAQAWLRQNASQDTE